MFLLANWTKKLAVVAGTLLLSGVYTGSALADKSNPPHKQDSNTTSPQPLSNADQNPGGANGQCPGGPYCSTRDGSPSQNGNGNGNANGKPCAGCVGKADNKNPQGQKPNGSDGNNGYECDGNNGIGKSNPAHTACRSGSPPPAPQPSPTPTPTPAPVPTPTATPNGPTPTRTTTSTTTKVVKKTHKAKPRVKKPKKHHPKPKPKKHVHHKKHTHHARPPKVIHYTP